MQTYLVWHHLMTSQMLNVLVLREMFQGDSENKKISVFE